MQSAPTTDTAPISSTESLGSSTPATPETGAPSAAAPQAPSDNVPQVEAPSTSEAAPTTPKTAPDAFGIPEEYKRVQHEDGRVQNAWTDKIKSVEDLWKAAANAQSVIGKKYLAPDFENATENEIQQFLETNRPESEEAYNFKTSEGYVETGMEPAFAKMLHETGITEYQGNKLIAAYQNMEAEQKAKMYEPEAFDRLMEESFGNGYKTKALQAQEVLNTNMTETQRQRLEGMPNQIKQLFYEYASNVEKAYGATEGGPAATNRAGTSTVMDPKARASEIRKEMRTIHNSPNLNNGDKYQQLQQELNTIYGVGRK